jgi:tetratricopeptide (TPR) repeat protein
VELLERAAESSPRNSDYHYNLGIALEKVGKIDEAMGAFNRVLEIDPERTDALNNRGLIYWRLGKLREAENDFRKGLSLNPKDNNMARNLGLCLLAQKRPDEAMEALKTALKLDSRDPGALRAMGDALCQRGDWEKAVYYYSRAIRRCDSKERMSQICEAQGLAFEMSGNKRRARRVYRKALSQTEDGEAIKRLEDKIRSLEQDN